MDLIHRFLPCLQPQAGTTYRHAGQVPLLFRAVDPWGSEHTRPQRASSYDTGEGSQGPRKGWMSRKGDRKAVHISWSLPGQVSGIGRSLEFPHSINYSLSRSASHSTNPIQNHPPPPRSALGPGMDAVKNPRRTKKWSLNSQNCQASNRGNTYVHGP